MLWMMTLITLRSHETPMQRFCINHLKINNFRSFAELELTLHDELTVLVARNGAGKTAILSALAVGLRSFTDTMLGAKASPGFERTDIRRTKRPDGPMVLQLPTSVQLGGALGEVELSWSRELLSETGKTKTNAPELIEVANSYLLANSGYADQDQDYQSAPVLPVIANYGTGRLWSEGRISKAQKSSVTVSNQSIDAYRDCLAPSSSYRSFALWFEAISREAQRPNQHKVVQLLQSVRDAVDHVLATVGWSYIDWSFLYDEIVARHHEQGELPVSLLSDGVRNVIALVADIAHRCARLNPQFGAEAARKTPGIVLIDEVDMHLHPSWQQVIIGSLREAFPLVQFIVTTHSPQVLSTVPAECLRILEQHEQESAPKLPSLQTQGISSADVLSFVMGVDPQPQVKARELLNKYQAMIQDGAHLEPDALKLRAQLEAHFGADHPEMLDCDRLIRFQALRARKGAPQEGR